MAPRIRRTADPLDQAGLRKATATTDAAKRRAPTMGADGGRWSGGADAPASRWRRPTRTGRPSDAARCGARPTGAGVAAGFCGQEAAVAAEQAVEQDPDEDHDAARSRSTATACRSCGRRVPRGRGACGGSGGPGASSASRRGGGACTGGGTRTDCRRGGDFGRVGIDPGSASGSNSGSSAGLQSGSASGSGSTRAPVLARAPGRARAPVRARTPGPARAPARTRRRRPPRSAPRRPSRAPTSRRVRSRRRAPRARRDRRAPPPACPRVVRSLGSCHSWRPARSWGAARAPVYRRRRGAVRRRPVRHRARPGPGDRPDPPPPSPARRAR